MGIGWEGWGGVQGRWARGWGLAAYVAFLSAWRKEQGRTHLGEARSPRAARILVTSYRAGHTRLGATNPLPLARARSTGRCEQARLADRGAPASKCGPF